MIGTNSAEFSDSGEARSARRWLGLAIGSLILAGLFAAALVVARAPGVSALVTDPAFFRRCLVVHVDLALVVWVYAFCAALLFLLPARGQSSRLSRAAVFLSVGGVSLMLASAGATGAEPVLANYVPVVDHWSFGVGLTCFGAGVVGSTLDRRLLPSSVERPGLMAIPAAAIPGLRATAIALVLAALTFVAAWRSRPLGLTARTTFELTAWGGGHVLQLASTTALLSVWLILVGGFLGTSPVSRRASARLFGILLLPWLGAPLLVARGVEDVQARAVFTDLMRFGLFPVVIAFLGLCVRALRRAARAGEIDRAALADPRFVGFVASAGLCVLGWVLGALIRGSTTMIPAHYHAAIGAVTVAFMSVAWPYLEALGIPVRGGALVRRIIPWQPALFGVGQTLFAIGFAVAGAEGTARKVFGREQQVRTALQSFGLGVMGVGGLLAIGGGLLFLAIVVAAWTGRERQALPACASPLPAGQSGGSHV